MITREIGKTIRESREEMEEYTADHFRRASEDVLRHDGKVLPSTQERTNAKRIIIVQEPVGVVAAVSPWNFPVDIAGIPIVYGLAVGCTVVWKPSEYAPLCAQMFTELLARRRLPARNGQPRPRTRRYGARARDAPGRRLGRLHRLGRDGRAGRARRRASRTACSSSAGTARRSCSPTPTSTRRPTPRSPAASTSPASAARPQSGSSSTSR